MEETKMGACPKNKVSKLRGRTRRAHIKVAPVTLTTCHCGAVKETHRVCPKCGDYRKGVHVIDVKVKEN
jgi:large subunit ribosomal protein L32